MTPEPWASSTEVSWVVDSSVSRTRRCLARCWSSKSGMGVMSSTIDMGDPDAVIVYPPDDPWAVDALENASAWARLTSAFTMPPASQACHASLGSAELKVSRGTLAADPQVSGSKIARKAITA